MKLLSVGVPVIWLMIFSVVADMNFENNFDYEMEMNRLLTERTELLMQAYFEDREVQTELGEILAEPMLHQDLELLEMYRDTDLEVITGFKILEYELLSFDSGGAVIRAVIQWQTEDGNLDAGQEYTVILQHTAEGGIKMAGLFLEAEESASFCGAELK